MSEEILKPADYLSPLTWIAWLLSLPIRVFTFVVVRVRKYDPEKALCPGCGFKGDSGTNGKSCSVMCVEINEASRAALRHICFRCAAIFWTPCITDPRKWMAKKVIG
jgi:hypothetical protein